MPLSANREEIEHTAPHRTGRGCEPDRDSVKRPASNRGLSACVDGQQPGGTGRLIAWMFREVIVLNEARGGLPATTTTGMALRLGAMEARDDLLARQYPGAPATGVAHAVASGIE
jgi:hypothetical protein